MTKLELDWTDTLGARLLADLPAADVARLAEQFADPAEAESWSDATLAAAGVLEAARRDRPCRRALVAAWRQLHAELIEAARIMSIHSSAEHCSRMLEHFGPEPVLLEILTDEDGDGRDMATWIIASVEPAATRRQLESLLETWYADRPATAALEDSGPRKRVVIFGGHQRDESKLAQRLFAQSPFDVRWKPCAKHQGSPDDRVLEDAMSHADGVIVVTSMVSHNVMRAVKRYVQEYNIPWRAVSKATELQLRAIFAELFPELPLA